MTIVNFRLMIVEDDKTLLQALCTALTAEGFNVEGFNSPREALAALRPGEFDLVLTDLKMPEVDGISLIAAARKIDADIGAIVMTGYGSVETAAQAIRGGALDYVPKPIKLHVLLPVIRRALDIKRLHHQNAALSQKLAAVYLDLRGDLDSISHEVKQSLACLLDEKCTDRLESEDRRIADIVRDSIDGLDRSISALLERKRQSDW